MAAMKRAERWRFCTASSRGTWAGRTARDFFVGSPMAGVTAITRIILGHASRIAPPPPSVCVYVTTRPPSRAAPALSAWPSISLAYVARSFARQGVQLSRRRELFPRWPQQRCFQGHRPLEFRFSRQGAPRAIETLLFRQHNASREKSNFLLAT